MAWAVLFLALFLSLGAAQNSTNTTTLPTTTTTTLQTTTTVLTTTIARTTRPARAPPLCAALAPASQEGCTLNVCRCAAVLQECDFRGGTCGVEFCSGACVVSWRGASTIGLAVCVAALALVVGCVCRAWRREKQRNAKFSRIDSSERLVESLNG
jgi:hypothetical protein